MSSGRPEALAYLLTWTTYGTWLRGDSRGYVGRTLAGGEQVVPAHNDYGTPYDALDGRTRNTDATRLKSQPVYLTREQCTCVALAFCEVSETAGYQLLRASVMPDHVHVLTAAHAHGMREIMRRLKSISSVRLTQRFGHPPAKAGGSCDGGGRWWTRGGSLREKRSEAAVAAAAIYVERQGSMLAEVVNGRVVWESGASSNEPPGQGRGLLYVEAQSDESFGA